MRDRSCFCCLGAEALWGLEEEMGEPTVLEMESEGEARTSLEAPPPLVVPPLPCKAAVAAEGACCEADEGAMFLVREDSSWPAGGCCPERAGEKGVDVEDAADDLRLLPMRPCLAVATAPAPVVAVAGCDDAEAVDGGGSEGKLEVAGEKAGRGPLGEGVLRSCSANVVDKGVRRVVVFWCLLGGPQGLCWLI